MNFTDALLNKLQNFEWEVGEYPTKIKFHPWVYTQLAVETVNFLTAPEASNFLRMETFMGIPIYFDSSLEKEDIQFYSDKLKGWWPQPRPYSPILSNEIYRLMNFD